jgi:hypothetical protein
MLRFFYVYSFYARKNGEMLPQFSLVRVTNLDSEGQSNEIIIA